MAKPDFYNVLGIPRSATEDDIKKAYRKIALENHPDRHQQSEPAVRAQAEARFKEANDANEVLSNASKKALYDKYGHLGLERDFDPRAYEARMEEILRGARNTRREPFVDPFAEPFAEPLGKSFEQEATKIRMTPAGVAFAALATVMLGSVAIGVAAYRKKEQQRRTEKQTQGYSAPSFNL